MSLLILLCAGLSSSCSGVGAILNGNAINPDDFKYHVSLWYSAGASPEFVCSGAVLDELHILTTIPCISDPRNPTLYSVVAGEKSLRKSHQAAKHTVKCIYYYCDYNQCEMDEEYPRGIAVLVLEKPLQLGGAIDRVHLPGKNPTPPADPECSVAGWGDFDAKEASSVDTLSYMRVNLPNLVKKPSKGKPHAAVKQSLRQELTIVDADGKASLENGDRGSPVVCKEGELAIVYGVIVDRRRASRASLDFIETTVRATASATADPLEDRCPGLYNTRG